MSALFRRRVGAILLLASAAGLQIARPRVGRQSALRAAEIDIPPPRGSRVIKAAGSAAKAVGTQANRAKTAAVDLRKRVINEPPRKIALLVEPTPFTHVSGYANRFKEQLKYLKEFGDEVAVATPDYKEEAPDEYLGYPITTLDGFRFPLYAHLCLVNPLTWGGAKLKSFFDDFKPDLIHASSPGMFAIIAPSFAKALDVPLVMSYHTHLPVYAENYAKWLPFSRKSAWLTIKAAHANADLTIVTSPQIQQEFREQDIKRVKVWPKGIDVDRFSPTFKDEATREVLCPGKADKTILLYVGRISVEKRLEDVTAVLRARPETVFSIVGGGPHEAGLKAHFKEFGDRVHFVGMLHGDELSKAYASADLFTMPSDSETLGFVVLEAMASGLPVVAANAGGIPSIVSHDSNGLLCPPGDTEAFTAGVSRVLDNASLADRLKTRGRKDAEGWSWRASTRTLRNRHYRLAVRLHKMRKNKVARDLNDTAALLPAAFRPLASLLLPVRRLFAGRFTRFVNWVKRNVFAGKKARFA